MLELIHGSTVQVRCAGGTVRAASLVLACNAHLEELEPKLSGKVLPAGSYIIATEPLSKDAAAQLIPHNVALCDQKVGLDYYRLSADRRLLFGGACHYSGARSGRHCRLHAPANAEGISAIGQCADRLPMGRHDRHLGQSLPPGRTLEPAPERVLRPGLLRPWPERHALVRQALGEAIHAGHSQGFDVFSAVPHMTFPGGRALRSPLLALGMLWYRMREMLG